MDHDVYESHMIDTVNRHSGEPVNEPVEVKRSLVMNKNDARTLVVGLKRTLLALVTATILAISVIGFIAVAKATGYIAVLLFFASILGLLGAYILLYAQGITCIESRGESK
jgi:hypothetical protein